MCRRSRRCRDRSFPDERFLPDHRDKGNPLPMCDRDQSRAEQAMAQIGQEIDALSCIRLNEAAPVIGDTAMETLTETIITDSSMIGHNPSHPRRSRTG